MYALVLIGLFVRKNSSDNPTIKLMRPDFLRATPAQPHFACWRNHVLARSCYTLHWCIVAHTCTIISLWKSITRCQCLYSTCGNAHNWRAYICMPAADITTHVSSHLFFPLCLPMNLQCHPPTSFGSWTNLRLPPDLLCCRASTTSMIHQQHY